MLLDKNFLLQDNVAKTQSFHLLSLFVKLPQNTSMLLIMLPSLFSDTEIIESFFPPLVWFVHKEEDSSSGISFDLLECQILIYGHPSISQCIFLNRNFYLRLEKKLKVSKHQERLSKYKTKQVFTNKQEDMQKSRVVVITFNVINKHPSRVAGGVKRLSPNFRFQEDSRVCTHICVCVRT